MNSSANLTLQSQSSGMIVSYNYDSEVLKELQLTELHHQFACGEDHVTYPRSLTLRRQCNVAHSSYIETPIESFVDDKSLQCPEDRRFEAVSLSKPLWSRDSKHI